MLFKYDKDKYSLLNVYKELGTEIFNYGWVINRHENEGWEYNERVMSLYRVEREMAVCWAPKTRIEIPVKDLSLTKEDAIKFETHDEFIYSVNYDDWNKCIFKIPIYQSTSKEDLRKTLLAINKFYTEHPDGILTIMEGALYV